MARKTNEKEPSMCHFSSIEGFLDMDIPFLKAKSRGLEGYGLLHKEYY
jgi:hypothetical protein